MSHIPDPACRIASMTTTTTTTTTISRRIGVSNTTSLVDEECDSSENGDDADASWTCDDATVDATTTMTTTTMPDGGNDRRDGSPRNVDERCGARVDRPPAIATAAANAARHRHSRPLRRHRASSASSSHAAPAGGGFAFPSSNAASITPLHHVPYVHGGYAAAAPLFVNDAKFASVLRRLLPGAYDELGCLMRASRRGGGADCGRNRGGDGNGRGRGTGGTSVVAIDVDDGTAGPSSSDVVEIRRRDTARSRQDNEVG